MCKSAMSSLTGQNKGWECAHLCTERLKEELRSTVASEHALEPGALCCVSSCAVSGTKNLRASSVCVRALSCLDTAKVISRCSPSSGCGIGLNSGWPCHTFSSAHYPEDSGYTVKTLATKGGRWVQHEVSRAHIH